MKKLCGLGLSAIVPNNGGIGAETKLSMRHQELSCSLPLRDCKDLGFGVYVVNLIPPTYRLDIVELESIGF